MYKTIKIGKIRTSKTELVDIAKAWAALSLAFAFLLYPTFFGSSIHLLGNFSFSKLLSQNFFFLFIISLLTAGIGFLLHELGHKFVAQYYGCEAEFRAWDQLLYLAVGLAVFVGFIFAAPGAVIISGSVTRKENGIISLAGPSVNYILALVFLGMGFLYPSLNFIFSIGFRINMWLGLFNMIPFGNFDGKKILNWNQYVWLGMVLIGIIATDLFGLRRLLLGF